MGKENTVGKKSALIREPRMSRKKVAEEPLSHLSALWNQIYRDGTGQLLRTGGS